jgi:ABC-2 type transport system permease protein
MGYEFTLRRVGRFSQGTAVLVWGAYAADVAWTPGRLALLIAAILGGACMFLGLIMIQAVMAIWTTEPLEIMNAFTYGGVYAAQYPLSVYRAWFRRFFTFIIPLAFVNYIPALTILGRADAASGIACLGWLSPLPGIAFLLVALRIWRFGVRHYCSTGS